MIIFKSLLLLIILTFACFTAGCSTINHFQEKRQQKKETRENKRIRYMDLKRDISTNRLRNGTTIEELKSRYGVPDDIFYSSSSVSSFQVWTYNIFKDKLADTTFSPIILYIENDKMVSWKN